jgi:hypothetical protein
MKCLGQDEDGRLIIDGEGVKIEIEKPIPGDSPAFLQNFVFLGHWEDKEDKN